MCTAALLDVTSGCSRRNLELKLLLMDADHVLDQTHLWYSTNLVGVPARLLASTSFTPTLCHLPSPEPEKRILACFRYWKAAMT